MCFKTKLRSHNWLARFQGSLLFISIDFQNEVELVALVETMLKIQPKRGTACASLTYEVQGDE